MRIDEIIELILSANVDTSRDEVWRKIREKQKAAGGFLTDGTAARLVASELGVEIKALVHLGEIPIGELVFGLNDVSVVGRVVFGYPLQGYARKNGIESQFARLIVADKTGALRVLLWNDKVSLVRDGKIKQGQIVRILHGYVREARDGQLELHLGNRGELQVNPPDTKEENYPVVESFFGKIGELTKSENKASIVGMVENVSSLKVFQRQNGTEGKILRLNLKDTSGKIAVVLWNSKADALKDVQVGERLQVIDAKVKERINGQLELHVEDRTYVERLPRLEKEFSKISSLASEGGPVSVEGTIKTEPVKREVTTTRGEKVLVTTFELEDDSGVIWVSAWRKHADAAGKLTMGTGVQLKNVYVKRGFGDLLELVTRALSRIEVMKR